MTSCLCRFFFSGSASTPIYTLSLHDALPTLHQARLQPAAAGPELVARGDGEDQFREYSNVLLAGLKLTVSLWLTPAWKRSEEHTSELQSQSNLVCRLLLEKKNTSYFMWLPS